MPIHLQLAEARRIAVRAARLDANRPGSVLELVESVAMLRIEQTPTVAPAADHVGWSRLGPDFRPSDIDDAVRRGELFERGWMLRPMSDLPLFVGGMRTWAKRAGAQKWMEANAAFARRILKRIEADGPLTSTELPNDADVDWVSTGWTNTRNVTQMLEFLHMTGQLAVVGREGRLRLWDLAERVFPDVEEVPAEESRRIRSERLLRACGIMRDSIAVAPTELHGVVPVGEPATIEGVPGKWRVDVSQLDGSRTWEPRTAILSPFDRLMTDKNRVVRLFDFDYTLEMFKPVEQRIWGQFALPILHDENLVGKVDARSDRATGRFVVHRIHEDEPFDPETKHAVDAELAAFADWLGLELVTERSSR